MMPRWLLPESISDILPSEARRIEELRRVLLDLYRSYGYELVQPPLLEHLDSLLTGSGGDLGLRTFQLVDQLSGRILGLRADMTPQVARIDAHLLNRQGIVRLCYAGPVLHTRPAGLFASREPLHIGAELYGHTGIEADLEIIELMTRSLRQATNGHIRIDLCHSGIVPALLALDPALEEELVYELLVRKDLPGLQQCLAGSPAQVRDALLALPSLYGSLHKSQARQDVLALARSTLPTLPGITAALDQLRQLAGSVRWSALNGIELSLDLADLRGYRYHSGITFAAYVDGLPNTVARGGRYDNVGRAFGRARPATGFSLELRELAGMLMEKPPTPAIRAPWDDSAALIARMESLRDQGEIVIQALPGHEHEHEEFTCDRELVFDQGQWVVRPLADN